MTAVAKPRVRVRAGSSMSARFIGTGTAYEGASTSSQELSTWNPLLSEANDELGSRDRITARVRDLDRNSSIAHGGIDRRVNATVGAEMWVKARPNWRALGLTLAQGAVLADQMEAAWNAWAYDPWHLNDVQGELTFPQQVRLAYYHVAREEEAVAILYGSEPNGIRKFATQVRIVDPDLLSTPAGMAETPYIRNGIETTIHGRPIAYHFEREHPNATVRDHKRMMQWVRVPRYTRSGRPQVVHFYSKRRAGVQRGVSKLAAGLKQFKQLQRYNEAELNAQLLAAMLPLFIKSKTPETAYEALAPGDDGEPQSYTDQRAAYHEASKLTLNGVRIPALFENEELDSVDTRRTGADFEKFQAVALRAMAPIFGLTYEQLSNDWGNVNYSSARAALIEIWRTIDADRSEFTVRFCTPIYQAVIWEAIDRGMIVLPAGAPDFVTNMAHYTRCRWIGPGRGWVDPVKEATGAGMRVDRYFTDAEEEAAQQGEDINENMENAARLQARAKELGLAWPGAADPAMAGDDGPEEQPGGARQRRQQ